MLFAEISSPKLKLVEDKVFLHFCVHIDDPSRADDFNNIVTVTLNTRPYGCNWKVPKVANVVRSLYHTEFSK